jgi:hypothetical protein
MAAQELDRPGKLSQQGGRPPVGRPGSFPAQSLLAMPPYCSGAFFVGSDDHSFIDRLLRTNAEFRALLEARRREADEGNTLSLESVRERFKVSRLAE